MPESRPPIELRGLNLADLQKLIEERRLPPVDQWNPEHWGHSGMRIARDGTWYHEGTPIRRPAMVRLFSTVLRREPDGRHVLVTPVEKLEIEVEATAFRAVEMSREGVPLVIIQRQLGHADLGITSAYLRGIDNTEIIHAVHERPAPMIPASTGLLSLR